MTLAEILPEIRTLSREDRIRVAQYVLDDLAKEKCLADLDSPFVHTIWSPYDANEAAALLDQFLNEHKTT